MRYEQYLLNLNRWQNEQSKIPPQKQNEDLNKLYDSDNIQNQDRDSATDSDPVFVSNNVSQKKKSKKKKKRSKSRDSKKSNSDKKIAPEENFESVNEIGSNELDKSEESV